MIPKLITAALVIFVLAGALFLIVSRQPGVWVVPETSRYHLRPNCKAILVDGHQAGDMQSLEDAITSGYTLCEVCGGN